MDSAAGLSGWTSASRSVTVVSSTWGRESHELFDFEASPEDLHTKTFSAQSSVIAVRSGLDVHLVQTGCAPLAGFDSLLQVVEQKGVFYADQATGSRRLWTVVRDMESKGCRLHAGDLIRLGRLKFRVRQLVTNCLIQPDLGVHDARSMCSVDSAVQVSDSVCRICLMQGPGEGDPLISPCKCSGSIRHVHLNCLRQWTKERLSVPRTNLGSSFFRPLACELCGCMYPTYVAKTGTQTGEPSQEFLMEVPRAAAPYIVLECLKREPTTAAGLHIASLAGKALMVGRGRENDIRISDSSISRCHAGIHFDRGGFWLKDNRSKFGTLVALCRPIPLEARRSLCLQVGRTVLSLAVSSTTSPPCSVRRPGIEDHEMYDECLQQGCSFGALPSSIGDTEPLTAHAASPNGGSSSEGTQLLIADSDFAGSVPARRGWHRMHSF